MCSLSCAFAICICHVPLPCAFAIAHVPPCRVLLQFAFAKCRCQCTKCHCLFTMAHLPVHLRHVPSPLHMYHCAFTIYPRQCPFSNELVPVSMYQCPFASAHSNCAPFAVCLCHVPLPLPLPCPSAMCHVPMSHFPFASAHFPAPICFVPLHCAFALCCCQCPFT